MITKRDFARTVVLGGLLGLLAGVAVMAAAVEARDTEAKIENFTFVPQRLTIKAGTTVTWTNADHIPHAVASTTKAFKSELIETDDKFSFTFTSAGLYEYFCSVHPRMTGTIVVEEGT